MSADLKLARLLETFDDIDISFVESLIQNNPNASLQHLINQCQKHMDNTSTINDECIISSEAVCIGRETDILHISTLDNIEYAFHHLFDEYLQSTHLFKLIDIFNHLTIMREAYKYNNNYNQNTNQLHICIKTVYTFMNNIYKHPNKEKYRRIRESNRIFQHKIGRVKGSKLLLILCGWLYIEMDKYNKNNGSYSSIYLFESSTNITFVQSVVQFLNKYMKHRNILILPSNMNQNNPKHIKTEIKNDIPSKQEIENNLIVEAKTDIIGPQMSKEERVRQHRLKNFGDINSLNTKVSKSKCKIGPKLGTDYKNTKTKKQSKKDLKFRRSKHFNMSDIIRLRKIDFEREAAGPTVKCAMDAIGFKCLQLTNEFRAGNGLMALKWHQALCEIGKTHSKNMGEGIVPIGHDGFHDRVEKYPFYSLRSAENVAMSMNTNNSVSETAVNGWIKSDGHRKNLLGAFTHCGIGVYQNFDGAIYLTQLFAFNHLFVTGNEVADL